MPAAQAAPITRTSVCETISLRVHHLPEAGWKAEHGESFREKDLPGRRSNRTNQAQPPQYRPIRHRREGREAIPVDYRPPAWPRWAPSPRASARPAVRACSEPTTTSNRLWPAGAPAPALPCCCLPARSTAARKDTIQATTGLHLTDQVGSLREELPHDHDVPSITLALTIELQNTLFGAFEELLEPHLSRARASGTLRRRASRR